MTALLAGAGVGALAAGELGGGLPGGNLGLLRDLAGFTGPGLLCAGALGAAFGWAGPMAYLLVTEVALQGHPATPWVWAARPATDRGAAVCACLVLAAGFAVITVCGPREAVRE
jgi:hypothetical protein